jgi:hypothetical protein
MPIHIHDRHAGAAIQLQSLARTYFNGCFHIDRYAIFDRNIFFGRMRIQPSPSLTISRVPVFSAFRRACFPARFKA